MEIFAGGLVGLVIGSALMYLLVYSALRIRFEAQLDERLRENSQQVKEQTLKSSSATLRGQIGERFAPFVPGFGHEPADARFLGSPIDYVVFDGMAIGQVSGVAFVEVKLRGVPLTPFQRQVKEAIDGGRVTWRVVEFDA